ncbi:fumarylacetoacetate hydrolase family protein [Natronohydrobacter thiooxidans]|uniref:fumarylacetoacetate hydrolase family protein n=1 Tax=Natronohydrobacter thiooxidans TaxID=87172 RepID=UPI0008FF7391|nr:fumarylacetoacetate hydrolase family protein [Natronohydrobacter thiooxidans]
MKLATLPNGTEDGALVVVSRDLTCAAPAQGIAPSLLAALRDWARAEPALRALVQQVEAGTAQGLAPFDSGTILAPLPRAPQWLDGSAFLNHGRLMDQAFGNPPLPDFETHPLVYQGASDDFLGARAPLVTPDESLFIDCEGEFGVVVDDVPMGTDPDAALDHIRLIVQINDWSLRQPGPWELKRGFGFLQAKPSTGFAPCAITPDELSAHWRGGRVCLPLRVEVNDERIGEPDGSEMDFHFGQIIAHAARTRRLTAGTIIGSGTVSNRDRAAGSACITEVRVIEKIDKGAPERAFLNFGDRVRMECALADGTPLFGAIDQRVARP